MNNMYSKYCFLPDYQLPMRLVGSYQSILAQDVTSPDVSFTSECHYDKENFPDGATYRRVFSAARYRSDSELAESNSGKLRLLRNCIWG